MSFRSRAVGLVSAGLCVLLVAGAALGAEEPAAKPVAPAATAEPPPLAAPDKDGFIPLFNGKDLTGWVGAVTGYGVEDGAIFCDPKKGGNLFTAHQFADFVLKFDVKIPKGGNNGLGIRSPLAGDPAYAAMELQILDNEDAQYAKLKDCQYHGSVYCVVPAKRGALKAPGEWNEQEVRAVGPKLTVIVNGTTILDTDLAEVRKAGKGHAGLDRKSGHIGWLGHGSKVEFRNIRIKPLGSAAATTAPAAAAKTSSTSLTAVLAATAGIPAADAPAAAAAPLNTPPEGFTAAFNGKDLTGWKGLVGDPKSRAKMTPEALAAAQAKADENMKLHWKVEDGALVFDGKGKALCTGRDYGDFEMFVDWKIHKGGDSGIYIRGTPQVQIWDNKVGSGGLFNNQKNPSKPLVVADNPVEQWNTFRIKMVGDRVWVWLNGKLVVDNTIMENYWEREKPIYPTGQIELQDHGSTLWFRNVYIRELPKEAAK